MIVNYLNDDLLWSGVNVFIFDWEFVIDSKLKFFNIC